MNRLFVTLLFISIWNSNYLLAQEFDVLQVNDEYSDQELIEDIFLKGFCGNVTNIQSTGEEFSVGHFFNGDDIIGIDRGIIISCGDIKDASQPNSDTETTTIIGTSGDKDLSIIATASVFDASGISFDFVPLSSKVSFTYVFASEEYCEWVGTAFNDVFGFFVSGPGINGQFSNDAINVALLPGTEEFVSINSVNHRSNEELYIKNELFSDAQRCAIQFDPQFPENIEYDGFTVPMKAEFDVIPCETYSIRLVVGDVNDELYDSAVFLQMNSFDIGGNMKITASSETGRDTLISEGCTDGLFTFERVGTDSELEQNFDLIVNPSSTAILGEDIEAIPTAITFMPGETVIEIPIKVIEDNIVEGQEIFGLILDSDCNCVDSRFANLIISDDTFFNAEFEELEACQEQEFVLEPIVNGGSPPYNYTWNDGSSSESITTELIETTSFDVVVTDFCGRQTTAITRIQIKEEPTVEIAGEYLICNGVNQFVEVNFEGAPPWSLTYQLNQEPPIKTSDIFTQPFLIPAEKEGVLSILEFTDKTCQGEPSGSASIIKDDIEIQVSKVEPTCPNISDGSISIEHLGPSPITNIEWLPNLGRGYNPTELQAGNYLLTMQDERGCLLEQNIVLEGINQNDEICQNLNIYIPNIYSPNGDGQNDDFLINLAFEPQIQSVESFNIYDRWGNKVFTKTNFLPVETDIGFNANFNGSKLIPGVFSYVAIFNLSGERRQSVAGSITVVW